MGLGSSIAGNAKAKQAAEEARKEYKEKQDLINLAMAEDESWFNKQYYSDITRRTDVQNMLRKLQEGQERQSTINEAKAAVIGATPEARLAAQDSVNKSYADAVAEIASNASALKDQYLENWRNRKNDYFRLRLGLDNPEVGIKQNLANQWSQAGVNAFAGGASLLASGLGGLGTSSKAPALTGIGTTGIGTTGNNLSDSYMAMRGLTKQPSGYYGYNPSLQSLSFNFKK